MNGAVSVADDPAHCLTHVGGTVCNDNMALLKLNSKLGANLVELVDDVVPRMLIREVGSRQDEIVLLEVFVQPMS